MSLDSFWGVSTFNSQLCVPTDVFIPNPDWDVLPYAVRTASIEPISNINDILQSSNPTDHIMFTRDLADFIYAYNVAFLNIKLDAIRRKIPADLFISETIPLPDSVFSLIIFNDEQTMMLNENVVRLLYRNKTLYIIYTRKPTDSTYICPIVCMKTKMVEDHVEIDQSTIYINDLNDYEDGDLDHKYAIRVMAYRIAQYSLGVWYVIQHMLMHPAIKDPIFLKDHKEKQSVDGYVIRDVDSKHKKRRTRYVKYKSLNLDIPKSNVIRDRHALCWYVIGHYRHYKSGKKVWINGYWKGPLRELKKNLDDGRDRVLM